jgi:hypothetical protein
MKTAIIRFSRFLYPDKQEILDFIRTYCHSNSVSQTVSISDHMFFDTITIFVEGDTDALAGLRLYAKVVGIKFIE